MTEQPHRMFTDEEMGAFDRDGVVIMRGALSSRWIDQLRAAVDDIVAKPANVLDPRYAIRGGGSIGDMFVSHTQPAMWDFVLNSPVAPLGRQLMRSRTIRFLMDQVTVKGRSSQISPWHQDGPYLPLKGSQVLTVWLPFDAVMRENGMLGFVRGSHRWDRVFQAVETSGNFKGQITERQEPLPDIEADRKAYDIFQPDMEPGDAAFFSVWTLHGGAFNRTDGLRRAYTTRWVGDDVLFVPTPQTEYMVVEASLKPGHGFEGARHPEIV